LRDYVAGKRIRWVFLKTKILYVISKIDKALEYEWVAESLDKDLFDLAFVLLNPGNSDLDQFLADHGIRFYRISYRSKKDFFRSVVKIYQIIKKEKPEVVHCHMLDATLAGLVAATLGGVRKRIYTRHHSSLHHVYLPGGLKYDKLSNRLATHIIAISKNVREVLLIKENVPPSKVYLVHHGFKLEMFEKVDEHRVNHLRTKYKTAGHYPVIGVIARYTHWKGIQYIIPAFKSLLQRYPDAYLVLANARGDYKAAIQSLLREIPEANYIEIEFEHDLFAFYRLFDIFVHTPIDDHSEAFGQTYVEALAAGIPSIFTLSGIAKEFIKHRENAYVVEYQNSQAVYDAVICLLNSKELVERFVCNGRRDIQRLFCLDRMIQPLQRIYASVQCSVCGGKFCESKVVKNGYHLACCRHCGHGFVLDLPTSFELEACYHDYSYERSDLHSLPSFLIGRLEQIVSGFQKYRNNNRFLDVGFGQGAMLCAAKKNGWDVYGVEISDLAVKQARENGFTHLFKGSLMDAPFQDGFFDVVVLSELLEHLPDPSEFLKQAWVFLRPGGLLYVTTPNGRGLSARIMGTYWSVISPPEHLHFFSPTSLKRVLENHRFDDVRIRTEGFNPYEVFYWFKGLFIIARKTSFDRVSVAYQLNEKMSGSNLGAFFKNFANGFLNSVRLGDSLKVFALKAFK